MYFNLFRNVQLDHLTEVGVGDDEDLSRGEHVKNGGLFFVPRVMNKDILLLLFCDDRVRVLGIRSGIKSL